MCIHVTCARSIQVSRVISFVSPVRCEWVMPRVWMRHATYELNRLCEWGMSGIHTSYLSVTFDWHTSRLDLFGVQHMSWRLKHESVGLFCVSVTTISFLSFRLGPWGDLGIDDRAVPKMRAQSCLEQMRTFCGWTRVSKWVYASHVELVNESCHIEMSRVTCAPQNADEWDNCRAALVARYKFILGQAEHMKDKGDCEEECDDHGFLSRSLALSLFLVHSLFYTHTLAPALTYPLSLALAFSHLLSRAHSRSFSGKKRQL